MSSTSHPRLNAYVERRLTSRRPDTNTNTNTKPTRVHRERDFGVGYGNSSGYASNRSYIVPGPGFFRCR